MDGISIWSCSNGSSGRPAATRLPWLCDLRKALLQEQSLADVGFDAWHDAWQGTLATNLVGPANLSYCVARHMIERMGDSIRNRSPLGRVAIPLDIARTVLFLASEGSEFLTGCIVDINGASYLRT